MHEKAAISPHCSAGMAGSQLQLEEMSIPEIGVIADFVVTTTAYQVNNAAFLVQTNLQHLPSTVWC